jgi:hypothetical protein
MPREDFRAVARRGGKRRTARARGRISSLSCIDIQYGRNRRAVALRARAAALVRANEDVSRAVRPPGGYLDHANDSRRGPTPLVRLSKPRHTHVGLRGE